MANAFSKEEIVLYDQVLEGFQDALVITKQVSIFNTDSTTMERANNTIWRTQPYIGVSYSGMDQTANFQDNTQLSVPATLGFSRSVPWFLDAQQLRDASQEGQLAKAAAQKLASDINLGMTNLAMLQGTAVVKRTVAASGYTDVALCDSILNERGVPNYDRSMVIPTRNYNDMADNLQVATRSFGNAKSENAYSKAYVGPVSGFDTFKADYGARLQAAAGSGITISTLDAAAQYYTPKATSQSATTGETSNVDNRFQRVTVSATTNIVAGDAFTIATVNSVHEITKADTGQLMTFRVISVDSGTTMTICPPLITNQVQSLASQQYQNCIVNTKSATSALVFLNTVATMPTVFWQKDALEILPGRYVVPSASGVYTMKASTDNGIEVTMTKFFDINTLKTKYRYDVLYGLVNKQPGMSGIMLFSQS